MPEIRQRLRRLLGRRRERAASAAPQSPPDWASTTVVAEREEVTGSSPSPPRGIAEHQQEPTTLAPFTPLPGLQGPRLEEANWGLPNEIAPFPPPRSTTRTPPLSATSTVPGSPIVGLSFSPSGRGIITYGNQPQEPPAGLAEAVLARGPLAPAPGPPVTGEVDAETGARLPPVDGGADQQRALRWAQFYFGMGGPMLTDGGFQAEADTLTGPLRLQLGPGFDQQVTRAIMDEEPPLEGEEPPMVPGDRRLVLDPNWEEGERLGDGVGWQ